MFSIIKEIINWALQIFNSQRRVRFTIHKAFFNNGNECLFLNVCNLSKDRNIVLTHLWIDLEDHYNVIQQDRPLPKKLEPDEVWETWISLKKLPDCDLENLYKSGRLRLSTGKVVKSKQNKNVPNIGHVPGGNVENI